MQSKRVISTLIVATLISASCSKIFHQKDSDTAPSFNITDIESSREYEPHPYIKVNKEDSIIINSIVDSLPPVAQVDTMQIATDSIRLDSTALDAPQFIPFTAEQSSKMVIAEYLNAEFDDLTIDLSQSASHYPTDPRHVTSPYGWRKGRMHAGIDLKVDKGDNIYAAFDGVVRMAKYYSAYGYCIILRHDNGLETLYGHSSKLLVDVNDRVKAGDVIALGGSTGRSTGAHCHFETRIQGIYFDPNLVIDTKTSSVKQANLYIAKRGNRLFASNNDNQEAREAYILEQITIKYYTVKSGDVLSRIAARNNTTVTKLCQINGISSKSTLRIGQRLIVREGIKTPVKSTTTQTSTDTKSPTATTTTKAPTTQQSQSTNAPTYTYTVKKGDTLGGIAQAHNVSASTLCMLNGIKSNSTLQIGQKLKIPGEAPKTASSTASTTKSNATYHTVRSGDVLSKIASSYGTTVEKLCSINGISANSTLSIGQKIYLTAKNTTATATAASTSSSSSAKYHTVRSGDNLSGIAKRYGTTVSNLCSINNISANTTLQIGQKISLSGASSKTTTTSSQSTDGYHIVKSGDTLSGIASKYNTTVSELCRLNNITSRTTLQLEQKIKTK